MASSNVYCEWKSIDTINERPPSNFVFRFGNVKRLSDLFSYLTNEKIYNEQHSYIEASNEGLFFKLSNTAYDTHVCVKIKPTPPIEEFLCNNDIALSTVDLQKIGEYLGTLPPQRDIIGVYQFTDKPNHIFVKNDAEGMGILAPLSAPLPLPDDMPPVASLPIMENPSAIYKVHFRSACFALRTVTDNDLMVIIRPQGVLFKTQIVEVPLFITEFVQPFQFEDENSVRVDFVVPQSIDIIRALDDYAKHHPFKLSFFTGPPFRMKISIKVANPDLGKLTFLFTQGKAEGAAQK